MDERVDLAKIWDRARTTIQSFDDYIADVRKFYLGTVITISGVAAGFAPERTPPVIAATVVAVSVVVITFTWAFWSLEAHWYGFLRVAVGTAKRLEEELHLVDSRWGVTSELSSWANWGFFKDYSRHFLYFVVLIAAHAALAAVHYGNLFPGWRTEYTILMTVVTGFVALRNSWWTSRRIRLFLSRKP